MKSGSGATTRIVCLGGGYAAAWLARSLRSAIRKGEVELTVVSRDNYHTFHGFIGEMLTGKIQPGQITSPARRVFPPAKFHCAEIEAVDLERRLVTTSRPLDGRETVLPYDHLVLAIGSTDDLSRYPGLAEHAFKLKTYWDCFRARNHLLSMMELAEHEPDPVERRRLLTFVVAGGGYGGVEVAAELNDWARRLVRKEYPHVDPSDVRVMLVHAGDHLLPELKQVQPKLQAWAQRFIERSELEVRFNTRLAAATPEEVVLSTGERIPSRTLINCAGTAAWPLLDAMPALPRDERGRVVCDAQTRVVGLENVWAAGDCASVPHPHGGTAPPLGIWAMTVGRRVGKNILLQLRGKPLAKYGFTGLGDACSLGRSTAVAHVRGVRLYGFPAWVVWRAFLLFFVPSWDRKLRLLSDWLLGPFIGRDVVNPRAEDPPTMRREVYEPGQAIVREGDVGRRLFLVTSGEVEVVRGAGADATVVATLGAGSHFGERAAFENVRRTATVRAKSRVEVVSLGHHAAVTLAGGGALAPALRETPRSGAVQVPDSPLSHPSSITATQLS